LPWSIRLLVSIQPSTFSHKSNLSPNPRWPLFLCPILWAVVKVLDIGPFSPGKIFYHSQVSVTSEALRGVASVTTTLNNCQGPTSIWNLKPNPTSRLILACAAHHLSNTPFCPGSLLLIGTQLGYHVGSTLYPQRAVWHGGLDFVRRNIWCVCGLGGGKVVDLDDLWYIYIYTHANCCATQSRQCARAQTRSWVFASVFVFARAMILHTNLEGARCVLSKPGPLSDSQRYIRAQWDEHEGNLGNWSKSNGRWRRNMFGWWIFNNILLLSLRMHASWWIFVDTEYNW